MQLLQHTTSTALRLQAPQKSLPSSPNLARKQAASSKVMPARARRHLPTCGAGWMLPAPLEQRLQAVKGKPVSFCLAMMFVVSQTLFAIINSKISEAAAAAAAAGSISLGAAALSPLDTQLLYSRGSLAHTLAAWGPEGRAWFVVYEWVDLGLFFATYSGILLLCFNWVRQQQQQGEEEQQGEAQGSTHMVERVLALVRVGYLSVLGLLAVDLFEDLLQLLLCDSFKPLPLEAALPLGTGAAATAAVRQLLLAHQHGWWRVAAAVCCGVHVGKVALMVANGLVLLLGVLAVLQKKDKTV